MTEHKQKEYRISGWFRCGSGMSPTISDGEKVLWRGNKSGEFQHVDIISTLKIKDLEFDVGSFFDTRVVINSDN